MLVEKWEKEQKDIRKQEIRQTTYSIGIIDGKKYFKFRLMVGSEAHVQQNKLFSLIKTVQ